MSIFTPKDRLQKIFQILFFGKPCQLPIRMEAYIHQAFNLILLEQVKELPGSFLGETDGIKFQWFLLFEASTFPMVFSKKSRFLKKAELFSRRLLLEVWQELILDGI